MILLRLRVTALLLSAALVSDLAAQESAGTGGATGANTGGASGTGSGSAASSAFGGSTPAPAPSPFGGVAPAPSPATGNSLGLPPGNSTGFGGAATGLGAGATTSGQAAPSPSAEMPGPTAPLDSGPTTFSISTGYGKAPELFSSGEGRLTRPRFLARVSTSLGFDDNIFQTTTDAQGTPDVVIRQPITEGSPARVVQEPIPETRPQQIGVIRSPRTQRFRQVVIPAVEPEFQEIVIPGTPRPKRQASAISRGTFSFEAQTATRRTVFTFDLNVNTDYYWNRPEKKEEYNGDLAIRYLHRFTPRLQMTASVNASYLSQPDLSQINTPTGTGNGNYLVVAAKSDLSYRWAPRFSTVASLSYNSLSFEEEVRQFGDYSNIAAGLELRYLWKPKVTAVVEGRYSSISYPNLHGLDSSTYFALLGFDVSLSRRAAGTIRVGESIRTFEESGGSSAAPYLETTLNYQLSRASVLSWNNRFGFEEPPDSNTEVLTFRSGLVVSHVFGPRLNATLSINGIHRSSKNDTAETEASEDTLDTTMGFNYTLTRKWSFNLRYSYTAVFFDPGDTNYFRNRLFTGFDYAF